MQKRLKYSLFQAQRLSSIGRLTDRVVECKLYTGFVVISTDLY